MNRTFAEHVTSTAFFLSISKKQMVYLLALESCPYEGDKDAYNRACSRPFGLSDTWIASMKSLENKGLVVWVVHDAIRQHGHRELTRAGQLVCELLREAGLAQSLTAMERAA